MRVDQKILDRFDGLLEKAKDVGETDWQGPVDVESFTEWLLSSLNLVGRVAGTESEYYRAMAASQGRAGQQTAVETARAALQAARDDYAAGWIVDFKEIAAGEVFDDFLEMGQHLCENHYHIPAASVAGAVLEDSLRRLHLKHIGPWSGESKISKLNDALHKAGVYPQVQWRQIQTWGDIRNQADHGNFDKVDADDVARMVTAIRDFIVKYSA